MKKYITVIIMLFGVWSFGQTTVKKSSVSTGGGSATVGNTTLTYAIGEVAVQEATQGNTAISEGFIGPDIPESLGIADFGELQGVSVYPNPVKDVFSVEIPGKQSREFYLYDQNGKQILYMTSDSELTKIDISRLSAAVYILIAIDRTQGKRKIVKIEKL